MKKWRGLLPFVLLYSSITFTLCGGEVRFPLLLFGSSVFSKAIVIKESSKSFTVLKPGIICKFLIHSGCLQKLFTALVWNT